MRKILIVLLISSVICIDVSAAVVTLRQGLNGYTGTVDGTIYDTDTANSAGEYPFLYVGMTQNGAARRGLIKFDLSSITPASVVTSATLQFYIEPLFSRPDVVQGAVHKLLKAWTEGTNQLVGDAGGTGSPAQPGDTTLSHVSYNTVPWTIAGGDFDATASGTGTFGVNGSYVTISGAGLATDVQSWVSTPGTNFGWAVLGNEAQSWNAKRFFSSESPDPRKPTLFVEFTPPATVPDWVLY